MLSCQVFSCQHLYLEKAQVRIALFWIATRSVLYSRSSVKLSSVLVSTPISNESSGKNCFVLDCNMVCFVQSVKCSRVNSYI